MRVLVTGAAGFIGSHLCEALLEKGYKVSALVRYNSRQNKGWLENISNKNLEVIYGDVTDFDSVMNAINNCDYVFNLAASISVPYSFKNPQTFIDTNILGALNIFRAASLSKKKIKKIIQISSSEVYGNNLVKDKNILTEETITVSESPYAATKIASDNLAISMQKANGLPIVVARPFNTFGPRQSLRAVIPTLITQFISLNNKNNSIKIIGNPKSRGSVLCFTLKDIHPHDIATILDEDGVAIRAGHHCCQILHDKLGINATARASIGVYNNKEDIDKLSDAIKNCQKVFQI